TETYYEDPDNRGNPDLGAESAWVADVGVDFQWAPGWRVAAHAFARLEEDIIDYVRRRDTPPWEARNLGEMRTIGGQVLLAGDWRTCKPQVSYAWTGKEQALAPELESKYVFAHPRHQLKASVRHPLGAGLQTSWSVSASERGPLDDYATVEVAVSRSLERARLTVRIHNLTDARYEAIRGVPVPGRWVRVETQLEL
ncbi:TonB-dependent receptor, partial [Candidatus Latescibacterota bacterium]